eukprot:403355433
MSESPQAHHKSLQTQPNSNALTVKYSEPHNHDDYSTNSTSKQLIDIQINKVYPESPKSHRPALSDKNIAIRPTSKEDFVNQTPRRGSKRDNYNHSNSNKVQQDNKDQDKKNDKKLNLQRNFLLMDSEELQKNGIHGKRLALALLLRSKAYDVLMILLIVLYTVLIFIYFAFADQYFNDEANQKIFYIIELCILGIFVLEIFLHLLAFRMLYLKDYWNIFDLFIIILSVAFVLLDIFINNDVIDGILKIRGIFRLLRVFLLIRKLNTLRVKRDVQQRSLTANGYDLRSPLERVLEILNSLRDQIDVEQAKVIQDLNYCIKIISSNQLYEANLDFDGNSGDENTKDRNEVQKLLQNYSNKTTTDQKGRKTLGELGKQTTLPMSAWDDQKFQITTDKIEDMLGMNSQAKEELMRVDRLDFNIFKIQQETQDNELLSTFYYFTSTCGLKEKCKIDDVEFFTLIVAGACHDHEHPGFNNIYLQDTLDPIAVRYNDVSVLENHHIASSFAIMQQDSTMNVFAHLSKDQFKRARNVMIGSILGTDMSKHFSEAGKFKTRLGSLDFDPSSGDKDMTLYMMFHLADISNATKPWHICQKWTDLLFIEFFHQGDLERNRGSPISYLMDRTTVNIAKSQMGFLDVIINPSFVSADQVISLQEQLDHIQNNKEMWQTKFDEYEDQLSKDQDRIKMQPLKV